MQQIFWLLMTILAGALGGFLIERLRLPAGYMVGAIIAVAALNLTTGQVWFPAEIRPALQIVSGCFLGFTITRQDIRNMKTILFPALLLILCMVALNLAIGFLLNRFCDLSLATALLASAPGGMSDMALIADDLGADTLTVSLLQLVRLLSIYLIFPPAFRRLSVKRLSPDEIALNRSAEACKAAVIPDIRKKQGKIFLPHRLVNCGMTLLCSALSGLLLFWLKVPAGALMGAVIGAAAWNVLSERGFFYKEFRPALQITVGCLIGAQLGQDSLHNLGGLLLPAVIQILSLVILTAVAGLMLSRLTPIDLKTSLLAVTPGGIQEMSLLACDLHANVTQVLLLHTVRLFSVISIFPILIRWVAANW